MPPWSKKSFIRIEWLEVAASYAGVSNIRRRHPKNLLLKAISVLENIAPMPAQKLDPRQEAPRPLN
jgi:hypothetical protein